MFNTNMNYLYRNIAGKLKINDSNIKSLVKAYWRVTATGWE
jgi:hypothetical protein